MDAGSEAVIVQFALKGAMHTSPGCQPWEPHPREEVCSERTPHRKYQGRCPRPGEYAVFLSDHRDLSIIINELQSFSEPLFFIPDHFLDHKSMDLHGVSGEAEPPPDQSRTARSTSCGDLSQSNAGQNHTHRNQFSPSSPFDESASAGWSRYPRLRMHGRYHTSAVRK